MKPKISRRDFLRLSLLASALPAALPALKLLRPFQNVRPTNFQPQNPDAPNILILVFDALSGTNVSVYDYHRRTTPNLERMAQRATVFHRHYAGGSFTSPGTASLLTGTYPWSHRALHLYGTVVENLEQNNIFHNLPCDTYTKKAFTHNDLAGTLLHQFGADISQIKNSKELSLFYENLFAEGLLSNDHKAALLAETVMERGQRGQDLQLPSSVFFSMLHRIWRTEERNNLQRRYRQEFPRGLPASIAFRSMFLLEEAIDWILDDITTTTGAYFGYFHFLPPHEPYNTRHEFVDQFIDGWAPVEKPQHFFSLGLHQDHLNLQRRTYDEYIAYADAEFGRLYDHMEQNGLLDNTYLIVTSDHGEMFERGIIEHITPTLYEPITRIPLLISRPGQRTRQDVHTPTSAVDVLPTLLRAAGQPVPEGAEGQALPTFAGSQDSGDRAVFAMDAKTNPKFAPLQNATVAMVKERYKLIHYFGYEGYQSEYELYDLENDPEELEDLYAENNAIAGEMRDELQEKLREVDAPYRR